MQGHLTDGLVEVGANGRERYYDSSGYGRPRGEGVVLSRVEAAHLLYRGDLAAVDGRGFAEFLAANADVTVQFLVYKDLRDRGFYVSPARESWVDDPDGTDFVVHPRGDGPWDDTVEHRVRVVGERASVSLGSLGDVVLAVVDEESEITYLETDRPAVSGASEMAFDGTTSGRLLADRVLCWDPPAELYERGFYGQRLDRDDDTLQLSLLEAAYLAGEGHLEVDGGASRASGSTAGSSSTAGSGNAASSPRPDSSSAPTSAPTPTSRASRTWATPSCSCGCCRRGPSARRGTWRLTSGSPTASASGWCSRWCRGRRSGGSRSRG